MSQENFHNDVVSTSKFYMMRCLVTMAHADGVFCDIERAYMDGFLERLPFTDEQRAAMLSDYENPQPLEELLPYINDPSFRSQLSYFARLMAFKDGELHPSEQVILDKIKANQLSGAELEAAKAQAKAAAEAELDLHDITIENTQVREDGHVIPWFALLDKILRQLGIV